jgi:hypothetical protein
LVFFGIALIGILLVSALAVDMGAAYVSTSSLSKAADAGALAGARYTMMGEAAMRDVIDKVATANYGAAPDDAAPAFQVTIWNPAVDTTRIRVAGAADSPSFFARMIGVNEIPVTALAEATRYPLDMSLVLDLSQSLVRAEAFDDMQTAAKGFLDYFDDNIDRFGVVTYSTWAVNQMPLQKNFKSPGKAIIDGLVAISDTNIEEGLRVGKSQIDAAAPRTQAMKMVVLFTDGRATAFADNLRMNDNHNPLFYDGVVSAYISGNSYRGLFQTSDGKKIKQFNSGVPELYPNSSSVTSVAPKYLPGNLSVNGTNLRSVAAAQAEAWATQIRAAGYTVFSIGLGDPSGQAGDEPDLDFLRRVANENGVVSSTQPQGEMLFAPSAAELQNTFATLADRIITRLTR